MTKAELAEQWRQQATNLERSAQAYKRNCVRDKMMQNLLLAKQLRSCAEELESLGIPEMVLDAAMETQAEGPAST